MMSDLSMSRRREVRPLPPITGDCHGRDRKGSAVGSYDICRASARITEGRTNLMKGPVARQ
jgi:hypothetical protein